MSSFYCYVALRHFIVNIHYNFTGYCCFFGLALHESSVNLNLYNLSHFEQVQIVIRLHILKMIYNYRIFIRLVTYINHITVTGDIGCM